MAVHIKKMLWLHSYSAMMVKQHEVFKNVDTDHLEPFLGASPDGIAQCVCYSCGEVEKLNVHFAT